MSVLINNGIDDSYFSEYAEEYEFFQKHVSNYGKVPDDETVLEKFPGFSLLNVSETDAYIVDKLREERMYNEMVPILNQAAADMQVDSSEAVKNMLPKVQQLLQTSSFVGGVDIAKNAKSRLDWATKIRNHPGLLGLETGFDLLDEILGGLLPGEDLIVVAGRPGEGKSWTMDKMLAHNWQQGKVILLYSGEMGEYQVGARIDTLITNLSNKGITSGKLAEDSWDEYQDHISVMSEAGNAFIVVTPEMMGGKQMSPAMLDSLIQKYKPDLVGVDQLSLMVESIPTRDVQRVKYGNISKELFNLSAKHGVPIILNSQANRSTKEGSSGVPELEHLAESDGVGQNATRVIGMGTDEDILSLNIAKNRYGQSGAILEYVWDVDSGVYVPSGLRTKDDDDESAPVAPFKAKASKVNRELRSKVSREGIEAF